MERCRICGSDSCEFVVFLQQLDRELERRGGNFDIVDANKSPLELDSKTLNSSITVDSLLQLLVVDQ